jgi:hypothetical protein
MALYVIDSTEVNPNGMEEVTGSIPVRSTNQTNNLDGHGSRNLDSGYLLSGRTPRAASAASISLETFQRCQAHLERFSHLRGILPRFGVSAGIQLFFSSYLAWYLGKLSRNAPAGSLDTRAAILAVIVNFNHKSAGA